MSDLLNQASLVMIPSGYKEDVVYSQIPTDGSGDLSFTRASNGTRVNSAGLVEVAPWNMVTYSEQFTQYPPWLIQNITRADNVTTAPNGTTTAGKIYPSTTSSNPVMYSTTISVVSGQNYAVSIYAKVAGKNWIFIRTVDDSSAGVWFNLSTGVIGTQTSATGIIESVGNGWYRCTVIGAPTTTTGRCVYLVVDGNGSTTGTASGTDGIYIWGAQLNIGSTAKPYFPTTDRLNVPRLTYQNGGGGCPSLLLEKQSTNILTYSEDFSNSAWTKINSGSGSTTPVVTANYATSPDGTQNADRLQCTLGSSGYSLIQQEIIASGTHTGSIWVKSNTGANQNIYFRVSTNTTAYVVTPEWQRITLTESAGDYLTIGLRDQTGYTNYSCDILIWGAQLEDSSYATSYIPTTSSSATRVADACYKTGISSLIGQSQGSVFFDFTIDTISSQINDPVLWYMKDGGAGERYIELYSNGNLAYVEYTTLTISSIIKSGLTVGRHKCAIAYATDNFVFYVDGVQVGTDTSGTPNAYSTFGLQYYNSAYLGQQKVNQCAIFKTRLTNAELASLTTI